MMGYTVALYVLRRSAWPHIQTPKCQNSSCPRGMFSLPLRWRLSQKWFLSMRRNEI